MVTRSPRQNPDPVGPSDQVNSTNLQIYKKSTIYNLQSTIYNSTILKSTIYNSTILQFYKYTNLQIYNSTISISKLSQRHN
jgi:hypothetical protein